MMLLIFLVNTAIISAAVLLHYEALYRLSVLMPALRIRPRYRILVGIFGAFLAHVAEVWFFAVAYYLMDGREAFGTIEGLTAHGLLDFAYFSFITYTTLGYGDLVPSGNIRFLAGLEGLVGFMLITWTASFMFIEMQKYWGGGWR